MTLFKKNLIFFISFSLFLVFLPTEGAINKQSEQSMEINEEVIKENENNDEANVEEGKMEEEGETTSGENGKNSTEGKDENEGKMKSNSEEQKEFNEIVEEDRKIVKRYYFKIKSKLGEEAKKKESGHKKGENHRHGSSKVDELQGMANAIANGEMKCPGIFKRMLGKVANFVKRDAEAERKEHEWSENCHILSQMKPAIVDWLEFIAKYDEASPNGRKSGNTKSAEESAPQFPEKMTVRPILQKIYPKQNKGQFETPELKNESMGMEKMLEIYEKIAEDKRPEDLKQLFWDNEAAYKFVKQLEQKLESDKKHENTVAEDKDEEDLKGIWEEEKGVLSGQMSEFKLKKHQEKYSEHVDEQKDKKFGSFGTIWNYGKSIKNLFSGQQHQSKQLSLAA